MNVEELLVQKKIPYVHKGQDYLVCCINPDHPDRNPSMRVDQITGVFQCFSCEYKGNLFTHFGEKANQLQLKRELLKKRISEKRAESVGLSFPKSAVPYIGNWRNIKPETYRQFEAFNSVERDHIGRVVNPIQGSIILVEGIYDMINLHDKGLTNAVCCFGTKNINTDKLSMLKIQGIESVDIFFDGDDAGQAAAEKVKEMCEEVELLTRSIHLKNTDPGALTENQVTKLRDKLYA